VNPVDPEVTVLVPSFNHGRFLTQRIESIIAQTYKNFELFVIDDCSRDDSDGILRLLQEKHGFTYIANKSNTGTPFSAWERIIKLARGRFIWICESDDYAAPRFLESAVRAIANSPNAVIAYCDSWVVDQDDKQVDHTDSYFHDIWQESRWDQSFTQDGLEELTKFQLRGQTVPNMSSLLISTNAFRKAFTQFTKRFRLTGDWLFVGLLMKQGTVVYFKDTLNYFRRHDNTARIRVNSARSQAEYILTKSELFTNTDRPIREFADVMRTDAIRFLYEPASLGAVLCAMMKISLFHTLRFGMYLAASLSINRQYFRKFYNRLQLIKGRS
jgi:glycosyltransferase involved in cell wall biosynthesis